MLVGPVGAALDDDRILLQLEAIEYPLDPIAPAEQTGQADQGEHEQAA